MTPDGGLPQERRIAAGTMVAVYRIDSQLGQGGMGVVYRALDTKLNRSVAVKFLAADLADATARRRFQREAQLASSLNHPHLVTVFDIGEFEDRQYVVTEVLDGGTLRQWLNDPKPWRQTVELLTGVADGLAAAHSLSILHRDIKPENILLTTSGYAKLGDFGLAKLEERTISGADATRSRQLHETKKGSVLGTPAYMSPEQAAGRKLDARSDIFSFGVVLYEALTSRQPFAGNTDVDLLHQVIHAEPQPLSEAVPLALRMAVEKALRKDPDERYQSMRDLVVDLRHVTRRSGETQPAIRTTEESAPVSASATRAAVRKAGARWLWASIAGAALLTAGVAAGLYLRPSAPARESVRLQIPLPQNTTFTVSGHFAISPDGKKLIFAAVAADNVARFWVRALDSLDVKPLEGTTHDPRYSTVFWSPDSRMVAFRGDDGKLRKIDIDGGRSQAIGEMRKFDPVGGTWGPNGVILLGNQPGILRIDEATGVSSPVTALNVERKDQSHSAPVLLPDGRHFLYTRSSLEPDNSGIFVGSLDAKPDEQSLKALLPGGMASAATTAYADSRLLYYRTGSVLAQEFDPERLLLSGEPVRVVDQVDVGPSNNAYFSVSSTGVLVYRLGGATVNRQPTWLDRQGKVLGTPGEPGFYWTLKLSPDGKRLAYQGRLRPHDNDDIFVLDLERGGTTRITSDPAQDEQPVWSPDGTHVAYGSNREGTLKLFRRAADGSGAEERMLDNALRFGNFTDWTPDGRYIVTFHSSPQTGNDVWLLPLDGSAPFPIIQTDAIDVGGYVSPNGRWIAYRSDESGRTELYVQPFNPSAGKPEAGRKWMVSKGGALGMPRWHKDGREILYIANDGSVMAVPITTDPDFTSGTPQRLFHLPRSFMALSPFPGQFIDVTRDNQRFLAELPVVKTPLDEFTVVLNWPAGARR